MLVLASKNVPDAIAEVDSYGSSVRRNSSLIVIPVPGPKNTFLYYKYYRLFNIL